MKLSARNQLPAKVVSVVHGAVNSEVVLEVAEGVQVVAIITKHSAESLNLQAGREVSAVIKASDVMIATDD